MADTDAFIEISDDDDDMTAPNEYAANPAIRDFIILDDDDDDEEADQDLSSALRYRPEPQVEGAPRRNGPLQLPEVYRDTCQLVSPLARSLGPRACRLLIGDSVEVRAIPKTDFQDGDFLRVVNIVENLETGAVKLRGLHFRRNKFLQPMLPRKMNEVFMLVSLDTNDPRPWNVQGLEEVPVADVIRKRRLVVTDQPFPIFSYRKETKFASLGPNAEEVKRGIIANEVLVCRAIFAHVYGNGERKRKRRRPWQGLLRFILHKEADNGGGLLTGKHAEQVDLSDDLPDDGSLLADQPSTRRPTKERRYTMADIFMGAGGASCAAKMAGLDVRYGLDHWEEAVRTAAKNFPRARILLSEACDFLPPNFDATVAILHISPPCQSFSPANTNPNAEKDEVNTAALLTVGEIIKAVKPRLVTLEETFGLLTREKHQQWFGILLSMIHDVGYSVKWAIHTTLEYGISQPRKRLVMIAAAPGVPLPEMPKPTHGPPGSGLLPFITVRQAIGNLPRNVADHKPELANQVNETPWNPDRPFGNTVMTTNSSFYHWSGTRRFTNRELAGIQGFPTWYTFSGSRSAVEKLIGNAVPPQYFKLVFEQCIGVLRKLDREQNNGGDDGEDRHRNNFIDLVEDEPEPNPSSQTSTGSAEQPIVLD